MSYGKDSLYILVEIVPKPYPITMYKIRIKEGKEKQLIKHHPWVFTGAIDKVIPAFNEADWADVYDSNGIFIAKGWYDEKSHIVLHLLTWDPDKAVNENFIRSLIKESVLRRTSFFLLQDTTAFRLIHGEADFLPGLTADCYGKEIRVIISSRFAYHFLPVIINELTTILSPTYIEVTSDSFYAKSEGIPDKVLLYKDGIEVNVPNRANTSFIEKGIYYEVFPGKSQKSGFYCDQRENRAILEHYSKDKTVLDVCSYTGGFTLHALKGGAKCVDAIDSSESALRHLLYQVHINEDKGVLPPSSRDRVTITSSDAFEYVRGIEENKYDLIILDPPKLAQTKGKLENAQKAYKDLNRVAMMKIKNNGIIFTFSCSGAMTREEFNLTLAWAASDAGVEVQVLETLSAGSDHPSRLSFPESQYLTGLALRIIKN